VTTRSQTGADSDQGRSGDGSDGSSSSSSDGSEQDPDDWVSQVVAVVESIPSGRVLTYGGVAALLGSRSSRGVGKVMALAGSDLPWWRVIRASGHPPEGHEQRALEMYRVEGTPLRWSRAGAWRVDLDQATWRP
jgi:alkylated DNA nucleotide flippase Atl1